MKRKTVLKNIKRKIYKFWWRNNREKLRHKNKTHMNKKLLLEGQSVIKKVFETKTLTKGWAKKILKHAKWSQEKGAQIDNKSMTDPPG